MYSKPFRDAVELGQKTLSEYTYKNITVYRQIQNNIIILWFYVLVSESFKRSKSNYIIEHEKLHDKPHNTVS